MLAGTARGQEFDFSCAHPSGIEIIKDLPDEIVVLPTSVDNVYNIPIPEVEYTGADVIWVTLWYNLNTDLLTNYQIISYETPSSKALYGSDINSGTYAIRIHYRNTVTGKVRYGNFMYPKLE